MSKVFKIYVAGHNGMVGSAIFRALIERGHSIENIITKSRADLDLTNQRAVQDFFHSEKPDLVYLAAAKVGGIYANSSFPAEFIYENLMIQNNVVDAAFRSGVKRLLFLGSSCIYPKFAKQPMAENELLSGKLEETNEAYALAKIAGIKLIESYNRQYGISHGLDFRSLMPTNLYGPGDNYNSETSHVIPSLIRRFHEAKLNNKNNVKVWGSGKPLREFLHVDDLASASVFVMNLEQSIFYNKSAPCVTHVNVGSGEEVSIYQLSKMIMNIVGFSGTIKFETEMPDGTPRKLLNSSRLNELGWKPTISLRDGLKKTYENFLLGNKRF